MVLLMENHLKTPQVDKLGPVSEYTELSPSGLAGYSTNLLNQPSQRQPLYMGYSTEQQGIVQNRPGTSAFENLPTQPTSI